MWSTLIHWTVTQIIVPPVCIIATSQVPNHAWVSGHVDMAPASSMLAVFAYKNKQVAQIWIQVSHVETVSTLVEFAYMDGWFQIYSFFNNFSDNVESNWVKFRDFIEFIIEEWVPTKLLSSRRNQPWLNASLQRICKEKYQIFSVAKRSTKRVHWDTYRVHKTARGTEGGLMRSPSCNLVLRTWGQHPSA